MKLWLLFALISFVVANDIQLNDLDKHIPKQSELNGQFQCQKSIASLRTKIIDEIQKELLKQAEYLRKGLTYRPHIYKILIYRYWNNGWFIDQDSKFDGAGRVPFAQPLVSRNIEDIIVNEKIAGLYLKTVMSAEEYSYYRLQFLQLGEPVMSSKDFELYKTFMSQVGRHLELGEMIDFMAGKLQNNQVTKKTKA